MSDEKVTLKFLNVDFTLEYYALNTGVYRTKQLVKGINDLLITLLIKDAKVGLAYQANIVTGIEVKNIFTETKEELEARTIEYLKEYHSKLLNDSEKLGQFLGL